ncbi:YfkD famly protein [Bacillus massilinigeriensis]|uniref:YfkD famly protein n=1 Tax=Bacillus mediterraneensis TaxID=1805474 RepID=UPI0008F820C8|nr:YfkD famly protein [Bacillus mediterraneensis]
MKKHTAVLICLILLSLAAIFPTMAAEKTKLPVPQSVMNITKENTYHNRSGDSPELQPSELTQKLLDNSKVSIENSELIKLLNETSVNSTPFALGYRAIVYLGEWPLNYQSAETAPNWKFQKINTNYFDNRGGDQLYKMHYVQEQQAAVKGGLTAKVPRAESVQNMILSQAVKKTGLPLENDATVGAGTKLDQLYHVPPSSLGYLYAYVPAIHEKGKVTYGEVYLMLKGNKKFLVVKNVASQEIGAWIPLKNHVSFEFLQSKVPR